MNKQDGFAKIVPVTVTLNYLLENNIEILPRNYNIFTDSKEGDLLYNRIRKMMSIKFKEKEINAKTAIEYQNLIELILMECEFHVANMKRRSLNSFKYTDFISVNNITVNNVLSVSENDIKTGTASVAKTTALNTSNADSSGSQRSDSTSNDTGTGWANEAPTGSVGAQLNLIRDHATSISENRGNSSSKNTSAQEDKSKAVTNSENDYTNDIKGTNESEGKTKSDSRTENKNIDYDKVYKFLEMQADLNFNVEKFLMDQLHRGFLQYIKIESRIRLI